MRSPPVGAAATVPGATATVPGATATVPGAAADTADTVAGMRLLRCLYTPVEPLSSTADSNKSLAFNPL